MSFSCGVPAQPSAALLRLYRIRVLYSRIHFILFVVRCSPCAWDVCFTFLTSVAVDCRLPSFSSRQLGRPCSGRRLGGFEKVLCVCVCVFAHVAKYTTVSEYTTKPTKAKLSPPRTYLQRVQPPLQACLVGCHQAVIPADVRSYRGQEVD